MKDFFKTVFATVVGFLLLAIVGSFLFFMIIGIIISSTDRQVVISDNTILVIDLERQIVDRAPNDPFQDLSIPGISQSRMIGLDQIHAALKKAVHDDNIKGIYLNLSIVNGGIASIEEIRNHLIEFKDSSDKPIYAYGDMLDQKSYYLATVADQIVIHPMGSVDFRGLGGEMMFFVNTLDKLGIDMQIIRHGKFKAAVEPFMLEEMSEENREQTIYYLSSIWNHMLQGISEARSIPVEKLNVLADEVQTLNLGEASVESGLVDAVKYKDEVLDDLRKIIEDEDANEIPIVTVGRYVKTPSKEKSKTFSRNKIAVIYADGDIE